MSETVYFMMPMDFNFHFVHCEKKADKTKFLQETLFSIKQCARNWQLKQKKSIHLQIINNIFSNYDAHLNISS